MNKRFLLFVLLLTACSSHSDDKPDASSTGATTDHSESVALLADTKHHETATLIRAAADLVRGGVGLGSNAAVICWSQEATRPQVQEACLLAWSSGNDDLTSPIAASTATYFRGLLQNPVSRNTAIALTKKNGLVAKISLDELTQLLDALKQDPAWLRAIAAREWVKANPALEASLAEKLWDKVVIPPLDSDPRSLGESYALSRALGAGLAASVSNAYCAPLMRGFTQGRCLRFLSAIAPGGFPDDLKRFLPRRSDDGWRNFQRAFPERAHLLEPNL